MKMPDENILKQLSGFLFTLSSITVLHELGHFIGRILNGDHTTHFGFVKGRGILPIVPCVRGAIYSKNLLSFFIMPLLLQFAFIFILKKRYFWILFILFSHRFDLIDWLTEGCIII